MPVSNLEMISQKFYFLYPSFFDDTPAAGIEYYFCLPEDYEKDYCYCTPSPEGFELHPPLFYKKSTIIIVILSDPIPSFYLISSKVAGHISSNKLWLVKGISLAVVPFIGSCPLKYWIT